MPSAPVSRTAPLPHRLRRWATGALCAALAACAGYDGRDLKPGMSTAADVQASMGEPALRWQDADGAQQLAFPRGPEGAHTFMVHLGPDQRLRSIGNVLDERHFARIVPGKSTAEDVLRLIGPPTPQWTAYFAARDELVWEWLFCDGSNHLARFDVLFDGTSKFVRSMFARPDYRGPDGGVPPCGQIPPAP